MEYYAGKASPELLLVGFQILVAPKTQHYNPLRLSPGHLRIDIIGDTVHQIVRNNPISFGDLIKDLRDQNRHRAR
jgi:hypothetical protein